MGFLRKGWDSNPRSVISRTHDFQSCALDQLSHLCIYGLPWAIAAFWTGAICFWVRERYSLNACTVYHKAVDLSRGFFKKSAVYAKKSAPEGLWTLRRRFRMMRGGYFSISPVCSSAVRKYSTSSASLMTVVLPRAYSLSTISLIRATTGSRLSIWRSMSCSWK